MYNFKDLIVNLNYCNDLFVDIITVIYAIHDFSIQLRTGSNPVDIDRFQSHTGKMVIPNNFRYNKDTLSNVI